MFDIVKRRFQSLVPKVDFCALRIVEARSERITVRQDVVLPVTEELDVSVFVTVLAQP